MTNLVTWIRVAAWLLPASSGKNRLLRRLGPDVHTTAHAHANLVWRVDRVVMAAGARISGPNLLKDIRLGDLGVESYFGRFNVISAQTDFPRISTVVRLLQA